MDFLREVFLPKMGLFVERNEQNAQVFRCCIHNTIYEFF